MNQVLIEKDDEIPLLHFRWIFLKGSGADRRSEEGLTNYAMELFRRGHAQKSRKQINAYLAETCSHVSAQISDEMSTFAGLLPSDSLPEFSKRLVEVLQECDPTAEEQETLKKEIIEEQKVSLENPSNQCSYLFRRSLFEEDLYGNFVTGTPDSLKSFEGAQANSKRQNILSQGGYLVLGGDVNEDQASSLNSTFDVFATSKTASAEERSSYQTINGNRLALCHDPDQDQATVVLGWTGESLNHEEYMRTQFLEKMLCKEYSSTLCNEFRQKAGLTYGIYGAHRPTRRGRQFICRYQTATKFGPHFLEDLLGLFEVFAKGQGAYSLRNQDGEKITGELDFSKATVERYRNKIVNSMPFLSYTPQTKLARRLEEIFYNSPVRNEKWIKQRYLDVTAEELQEMSRQLFDNSGFVVAIVDNMEKNGDSYRQLQNWDKIIEVENKKSLLCGQI